MPFVTDSPFYARYFRVPAILTDTSALTWFAKRSDGDMAELAQVRVMYHLVVPTTVLYELAFGIPGAAAPAEQALRETLFRREHSMDTTIEFGAGEWRKKAMPGGVTIVNPGYNEWWTARDRLLKHIEIAKAATKTSKQNLSFDALIHACARNILSPICTLNMDDFTKLNRAANERRFDSAVPIFSPDQVLASLKADVHFGDQDVALPH